MARPRSWTQLQLACASRYGSRVADYDAEYLAERMPLVHFPARIPYESWRHLDSLSPRRKGSPVADRPTAPATEFVDSYIFLYAGPCCFEPRGNIGDTAIYFRREVVNSGAAVTPFDSGSVFGRYRMRLQPWATRSLSDEERLALVTQNSGSLADFPQVFREWLRMHYGATPSRYLDCDADRFAAGEPHSTAPQEILEHNGTRGRARYGPNKCADRRAWTWEVRVPTPLPLQHAALLHMPRREVAAALSTRPVEQTSPILFALPNTEPSDADALYVHSRQATDWLLA